METTRDKNGRFVKGCKSISPGRPRQKREDRFMAITQSACTFADWRAIVKKAVTQAKAGDTAARKWLADYLLGPPPQRIEHSAPEGITVTHRFDEALKRVYEAYGPGAGKAGGVVDGGSGTSELPV